MGLAAARILPVGSHGRNHLIGFSANLPYSIAHVNIYFDYWTRRRLLAPVAAHEEWPSAAPEAYRAGLCVPEYSRSDRRPKPTSGLPWWTLTWSKWTVPVCSTDWKYALPWLDYRLIEFAFGRVPDALRATETERKILPRRLAQRLLPPALDLGRKQGFSLPLMSWFKGEWGTYVETVLREADPQLFDQRIIQSLITRQHLGYANTARLFALTMFELWRREYRISVSN